MGDTKNLYNPHDGLTGRDGGPYLDQEERRLAEITRAAKEGREPDFDNAPATAGTPLVTAATLVALHNPASNPSQFANETLPNAVDKLAADESFPVNAFSNREKTPQEVDDEKAVEGGKPNPADPTVISTDDGFFEDESEDKSEDEV